MVGRKKEVEELKRLYNSRKPQLVAVYGRRRVGKTYLVDETFKGEIAFRHAGLSPAEKAGSTSGSRLKLQLKHFYNSLLLQGMKRSKCPDNWLDAFLLLELFLEGKDTGSRQVVFLDELPWMDTPKSGFITAFEGFWNTWGCHRDQLMVIICGSATAWVANHLINNHGGLYNRLTCEIKLSPFSLRECEEYFEAAGIKMSRYDIVQSYMITGGIPYYLGYFQKGRSLSQNIDFLFFSRNAKLKNEFERLFLSVFNRPELMKNIVKFLSTKSSGFTRAEIADKIGCSTGGTFTQMLNALVESDFIVKYVPFGMGKRKEHYRLTDPFCIFYIKFVERQNSLNDSFWQQNLASQGIVSWRGFAFENVCFWHIAQIKEALGISGVSTVQSAWSKKAEDTDGAQIDLLIERKDNVVNLCEIKFCGDEFVADRDCYKKMNHRQELLTKEISPKMKVHNTLITTYGLAYNEYSGIFDNVVTLDDLFR